MRSVTDSTTELGRPDGGEQLGTRVPGLTCLALFAVGIALYLSSLRYGFVQYDDVRILLDHPRLYDEHSLLSSLHEIFVGYFPREEPLLLRDVSWALDSRIFGFTNALGYHLGNVLLNAVNAPLLFLFLYRATSRYRFAALVAAGFVVLPVHVEPVCWVMGRKDLLSACFSLLTLLCEAEAFRSTDCRRSRGLRFIGLACLVLAIFSKTSAVTLVLAVAAYRVLAADVAGAGAPTRDRTSIPFSVRARAASLLGLWPHLLASGAAYLWYNRVLHQFGVLGASSAMLTPAKLADLARLGPLTLGLYVQSLFAFSEYSIIYQWPDSAIPLTSAQLATTVCLAVAVVAFVVWTASRRRDLLFYALAFFALMLPYLHLVDVIRWRADRYVYLSSFCILAVVVQAAEDLLRRASPGMSRALGGIGAAWALCAIFVTVANAPRFRDNRALWSYEVTLRQPSVSAYASLASSFVAEARREHDPAERLLLLAEAERVANAGKAYYESISWHANAAPKRDYAELYAQLGQVSALRGEPLATQLALYQQSHRIFPMETNILFLAQTLLEVAASRGDLELARRSLRLYSQLVVYRAADASLRTVSQRVLDAYRRSFPALSPEIDELEKEYLR